MEKLKTKHVKSLSFKSHGCRFSPIPEKDSPPPSSASHTYAIWTPAQF